ncbi:kinase-like domain-containing protein [Mycena rebaudengoi]|nr:kinase-like domain-containing protein [Mycena rebaudengoi]
MNDEDTAVPSSSGVRAKARAVLHMLFDANKPVINLGIHWAFGTVALGAEHLSMRQMELLDAVREGVFNPHHCGSGPDLSAACQDYEILPVFDVDMDFVQTILSVAPVPYLSAAYSLLEYIYTAIQQVQTSKTQLSILSEITARLLMTLDAGFKTRKISATAVEASLTDLHSLLQEISYFVAKAVKENFIKTLFTKSENIEKIDGFNRRITGLIHAFQVASVLHAHDWQAKNDAARKADQQQLMTRLDELQNHAQLLEALKINQENLAAMMVSLQRQIDGAQYGPESRFYSRTLLHLSALNGGQIEIKDWMVTTYDVDFGGKIGCGGFGDVYRGIWHKTNVALKVVRTGGGIIPTSKAILREIEIWSTLRHPNVLPFLGANHLDDRPFIVMPYMKYGNAREYLQNYQNETPLPILQDAARGLLYLHSKNVVHGDLKAANILIDNAATAVLCDFGLSRIKADMTTRTAEHDVDLGAGSRNWMSPERLRGALPKKPSDIYAFGMTIYELFSNEIPLGHVLPQDLRYLVINKNLRPDLLGVDDMPIMPQDVWAIAVKCWSKSPDARPGAASVCDMLIELGSAIYSHQPLSQADPVSQDIPPAQSLLFPPRAQPAQLPQPTQHLLSAQNPQSEQRSHHASLLLPQRTPPASYRVAMRKGLWNRRGDHLTMDGFVVYAPLDHAYPPELRDYPAETIGYRDHLGAEVGYLDTRPELPESIPRFGQPPSAPYEKFVVYKYVP